MERLTFRYVIIIFFISINVQTSKMSNVVHVYAIVAIIIVIKSNYNECDECKPSLNSCNVGASTICSGRLFQIFNVSGKNEYL